jgi:hypothetical protein
MQSTGIFQDGYCPHSGAQGPLAVKVKTRTASTKVDRNGHAAMSLAVAMADLVKARRALARAEASVKGAFARSVAAGSKPAVLARVMGVSRQRAHQIMKELGGVK